MNSTVKIKYKIENKEIVYWIMLFIIVSIYALLLYFFNKQFHFIYFIIMEFFVPVGFLIYIFINIFRCKKFSILCNKMKNDGIDIKITDCFIKVKKSEYHTKPLTQSMEVNIKTYFRTVKAYFVQTNDFMMLFFQLYDFGLFRRYIRPVVFKKNSIIPSVLIKNIYLIEIYEKRKIENEICIKLNKTLKGIEYLILPDNLCIWL
jgi:hypothetical protein